MKKKISILILGILGLYSSNLPARNDKYADPYVGSGGHGHVFVGANAPFGAIQVGPQNIFKGWDWCSGYHYSDSVIIGFTHTHLSGTGCTDLGDILLMPNTGEIHIMRGEQDNITDSYASYYSHEKESVAPGYYSLEMENGIRVELTASERVGFHKYRYPAGEKGHVVIDLKEGNGNSTKNTYLKQIDDHTLEGYRFSEGWSNHRIYFALKSDTPIQLALYENNKALKGSDMMIGQGVKGVLTFKQNPEEVMFKVSISSVSCRNALMNMETEVPHWDFNKVRTTTLDKWNKQLDKINIESKNEKQKRIFYSALYHTCIYPGIYADVTGEFRGHDNKVYSGKGYTNYSTFSLWDTYRAAHPLYTIIQPERVDDFVNSMLGIFDQQGKLPIWPLIGGETNQMPGYSAIPVIADAYLKGFRGFDPERAFRAMKTSAEFSEQIGIPYLLEREYIPADLVKEGTSYAMEYAVGDWAIAAMAEKMGKKRDAEMFAKRAGYYRHYWDKEMKNIRPKLADGSWRTPYDPFKSIHEFGDFCEGNGWQYSFFVPQDVEGLIDLFGGDEAFIRKLDDFFMLEGDMGAEASADISGLIGQYAHGNEPSHHIAYMYAYAGVPWKIAEKVRYILNEFYSDEPDGLIGNEDCGQMSSWYILSAMGFYPVNPAKGIYVFGSPLFDKVSIQLPENKTFVIEAVNNSDRNIYIQAVQLNGKEYTKSYIDYQDIMKGGSLKFVMGKKPNKKFGSAPQDRPTNKIK